MKLLSSFKPRVRAGAGITLLAAAFFAASAGPLAAADTKPATQARKKKLTGAELYAIHCNRCHQERYPTERTATQWKTIMLQMRVRANLPADQSNAILKYLQEDSGKQ